MQKFRFSLEGAMQYRQLQIDMERAKLEQLYAELRRLDRETQHLHEEKHYADALVKGVDPAYSISLLALDNFSRHVSVQVSHIETERAEFLRRVADQQAAIMKTQRDYDLLEKLRASKLEEWRKAADKELEQISGEAHLARIVRDGNQSRKKEDPTGSSGTPGTQ